MSRAYPTGTPSVPFVLAVDKRGPVAGLTVTAKILRSDGSQWDFSDNSFKAPGSVVTPTVTLVESAVQSGLYEGTWDTSGIGVNTEAVIIYQSTAGEPFIEDDQVIFTNQASVISVSSAFIEPVMDKTQKTLTVVFGLKDSTVGLLATTAATIKIKDELGNVILEKATTSTNGVHRAIFPGVAQIAPNRVYLFSIDFTIGLSTFSTADAMKVIGVA